MKKLKPYKEYLLDYVEKNPREKYYLRELHVKPRKKLVIVSKKDVL